MDQDRVDRMRASLRQAKLDALVLRLPENIVMGFGVWPMNGFSYAVFTADEGPVAVVAPSCEDEEMDGCWADVRFFTWPRLAMGDPLEAIRGSIDEVARRHKLGRGRIGYEGSFECVAPPHNAGEVIVPCESSNAFLKSLIPSARWFDATALLYELRATKTDGEIARLRVAQRVAGFGLEAFHQSVEPGMTEAEIAAAVYTACLTRGDAASSGSARQRVSTNLQSGPNAERAWRPIVTTGNRRLREGEIALLELACASMVFGPTSRGSRRPANRPASAASRLPRSKPLSGPPSPQSPPASRPACRTKRRPRYWSKPVSRSTLSI